MGREAGKYISQASVQRFAPFESVVSYPDMHQG